MDSEHMTQAEILDQLHLCGYKIEGGDLENNAAFRALCNLDDASLQPPWNDKRIELAAFVIACVQTEYGRYQATKDVLHQMRRDYEARLGPVADEVRTTLEGLIVNEMEDVQISGIYSEPQKYLTRLGNAAVWLNSHPTAQKGEADK